MRYVQQSSDTCAITTWRDRVYKRSRLRKDQSISSFATPSRALSDMRCQSRRVAVVVVIRICTGGVTSLGSCSFSRETIGRQVVLQTECYFSDVMEKTRHETGRAMFFEKPVGAAITASEIDEFAPPIGKKGGKSSDSRCAIFNFVCTHTRTNSICTLAGYANYFSVDLVIQR